MVYIYEASGKGYFVHLALHTSLRNPHSVLFFLICISMMRVSNSTQDQFLLITWFINFLSCHNEATCNGAWENMHYMVLLFISYF